MDPRVRSVKMRAKFKLFLEECASNSFKPITKCFKYKSMV